MKNDNSVNFKQTYTIRPTLIRQYHKYTINKKIVKIQQTPFSKNYIFYENFINKIKI